MKVRKAPGRGTGTDAPPDPGRRKRLSGLFIGLVSIMTLALVLWGLLSAGPVLAERSGRKALERALADLEAAGWEVSLEDNDVMRHRLNAPGRPAWLESGADEDHWACPIIRLYVQHKPTDTDRVNLPAPPPPGEIDPLLWNRLWSAMSMSANLGQSLRRDSIYAQSGRLDYQGLPDFYFFVEEEPYTSSVDHEDLGAWAEDVRLLLNEVRDSIRQRDPTLAPIPERGEPFMNMALYHAGVSMLISLCHDLACLACATGQPEVATELIDFGLELGRYMTGLSKSRLWARSVWNDAHLGCIALHLLLNHHSDGTGVSEENIVRLIKSFELTLAEIKGFQDRLFVSDVLETQTSWKRAVVSLEYASSLYEWGSPGSGRLDGLRRWLDRRGQHEASAAKRLPAGWLSHHFANVYQFHVLTMSRPVVDTMLLMDREEAWRLATTRLPLSSSRLHVMHRKFEGWHECNTLLVACQTRLGIAIVSLHIELHKRQHGQEPDSLQELEIEPALLVDLHDFTGTPLTYRKHVGGGYTLRSIGPHPHGEGQAIVWEQFPSREGKGR